MKRQEVHKDDPLEEMQELYGDIKEQESKFKKTLEICSKYIIEIL